MPTDLALGFIKALEDGLLDNDIDAIRNAVAARSFRGSASSLPRGSYYSPGDRVKITNIRPLYLVGQTGTLVRFKQKRWAFRPDDPGAFGRFLHPDGTTGLAPSMFEKA